MVSSRWKWLYFGGCVLTIATIASEIARFSKFSCTPGNGDMAVVDCVEAKPVQYNLFLSKPYFRLRHTRKPYRSCLRSFFSSGRFFKSLGRLLEPLEDVFHLQPELLDLSGAVDTKTFILRK